MKALFEAMTRSYRNRNGETVESKLVRGDLVWETSMGEYVIVTDAEWCDGREYSIDFEVVIQDTIKYIGNF